MTRTIVALLEPFSLVRSSKAVVLRRFVAKCAPLGRYTAVRTALVVFCAWGAAANAAQPAAATCDRECLRGKVTQLLSALLKHDVSSLPVADTLRVTEDAVEKPLAIATRTAR